MTLTVKLTMKHSIVQNVKENVLSHWYNLNYVHKFRTYGIFSLNVYKEDKEWVNGSKFGFYIFKNVWFDTEIIQTG